MEENGALLIQRDNLLFECCFDGVCVIDRGGLITDINSSFEQITGFSKPDLLLTNFAEIIFKDNNDIQASIKEALNGNVSQGTTTLLHENGECIDVRYRGTPRITNDEVAGIYLVIKDITELRRVENTLKRTQRIMTQTERLAHVGSWEYDPKKQASIWSAELFDIYGIENTGSIDISTIIQFIHPEDKDHFRSSVKALVAGEPYDVEFRIVRPDNEVRTLHSTRAMYVDEHGDTRLIGTLQDITSQKRTHQLLVESEKLAIVGQLAAGVAHEIRNPLTSLKGFLSLMLSADNPQRYIDIMKSELTRIETVTNGLLALARPQARKMSEVDLVQVMNHVIQLLQTQTLLKNVDINLDVNTEIPLVQCEVNPISQVFINIVKNAIEAAPSGGKIIIQVRSTKEHVTISVIDNGSGIAPEEIKKLGEPFYTTKDGGTGLGLMVSNKIVLDHGGSLVISSSPWEGTAVTVALPCKQQLYLREEADMETSITADRDMK